MKTALRVVAGLLAGLLASFTLIILMELFSSLVHPVPEGFQGTEEEVCLHVERYPQWVLGVGVAAWAIAAFAGTWIARRIGNLYAAAIVGLLLLAGLLVNIAILPYPMWFKIVILLAIPAALIAGGRARGKTTTPAQCELQESAAT